MFEEAFKRQPLNEDLGMQTFFANIRTGNWKTGQQVRHSFFSIQCTTKACHPGRVTCRHSLRVRYLKSSSSSVSQLATKLNKQFHEDRYVYWGAMCAVLQVKAFIVSLFYLNLFSSRPMTLRRRRTCASCCTNLRTGF